MARARGRETQGESERQGQSVRASGRCPIHPIEDTLLHLNGPLASAGPGMLMCTGADSTITGGHSGSNRDPKEEEEGGKKTSTRVLFWLSIESDQPCWVPDTGQCYWYFSGRADSGGT